MKTLEELGIGRPSTYASIIVDDQSTAGYVRLEDKRFCPRGRGRGRHRQADRALPRRRRRQLHRAHGGGARRHRRGADRLDPGAPRVQRTVRACAREGRALLRALQRGARRGRARSVRPRGATPGKLEVKLGRFGKFIGCTNYPDCKLHPEHGRQRCARSPRCSTRPARSAAGSSRSASGGSGRSSDAAATRTARYIKKDPPRTLGITCPQCEEGEIVEKRTRFGVFFGCDRYPDCDFGVNNEPIKDHPCPECGSVLVQPPEVDPLLELRRRVRPRVRPDEGGRRRGRGRGARRQGRRSRRSRRREEEEVACQEIGGEEIDGEEGDRQEDRGDAEAHRHRIAARRPRRPGRASLRCRRSPTRSPPSAGPSRRP